MLTQDERGKGCQAASLKALLVQISVKHCVFVVVARTSKPGLQGWSRTSSKTVLFHMPIVHILTGRPA